MILPIISSSAAHRGGDQHLQVAALALAHDGHRGEQHHGHGQDDPDQPGHDVDRRTPLRVVEVADLEDRRAAADPREAAT
jgi:hypothetical protein